MAQERTNPDTDSPAALVAIARAAKLAGDRDLERAAKEQLRTKFGIAISFSGVPPTQRQIGERAAP
jgi:hypothetical protein